MSTDCELMNDIVNWYHITYTLLINKGNLMYSAFSKLRQPRHGDGFFSILAI